MVADFAQAQLPARVRESLWARGVSDDQIDSFKVGYLNGKLPDLPHPADTFLEWANNNGGLKDVVVLPLTNILGDILGLQFRGVSVKKYSDFIMPVDEPVTLGLSQAAEGIWKSEEVWVVEGGFDMFPLQRVFPNVIPTLTAKVTLPLVRLLRRLVRRIWLLYDADKGGREATKEFLERYGKEFDVHLVKIPPLTLPSGKRVKDPGEWWEAWGDEKLATHLRTVHDGPWNW